MEFQNSINDILAFIDSEKCIDEIDIKKTYGIFNKCCIKSIHELTKIPDTTSNIIHMGIGMLYYIFFVILRYTNNIKLTIFLSERAILLYSEFIIQSSEKQKNGDLVFTPSLGDAITFAYKKTIGRLSIKHFEDKVENNLQYPLQDACLIMKSIFLYFCEVNTIKQKLNVQKEDTKNKNLDDLNEEFYQDIYILLENKWLHMDDIEWLFSKNIDKNQTKQILLSYCEYLYKQKKRIYIENFYNTHVVNSV